MLTFAYASCVSYLLKSAEATKKEACKSRYVRKSSESRHVKSRHTGQRNVRKSSESRHVKSRHASQRYARKPLPL